MVDDVVVGDNIAMLCQSSTTKILLIAKVLIMFALCNNNFILKHHTCASSKFHQGKITPLSFFNV